MKSDQYFLVVSTLRVATFTIVHHDPELLKIILINRLLIYGVTINNRIFIMNMSVLRLDERWIKQNVFSVCPVRYNQLLCYQLL